MRVAGVSISFLVPLPIHRHSPSRRPSQKEGSFFHQSPQPIKRLDAGQAAPSLAPSPSSSPFASGGEEGDEEAMDSSGGGGGAQIRGMATHGGRYVLYNVYGNLFEVSSKYAPPIRPIGRGAYGIVWCVPSTPAPSLSLPSLRAGGWARHVDSIRLGSFRQEFMLK